MIKNVILPENLRKVIGSEKVEFAVKSERSYSPTKAFSLIGFAIFLLAIFSVDIITLFDPVLQGRKITITINEVPKLFVLFGIGMLLGAGIYSLFKEGGYFVGTPTRLVIREGSKIRCIDWEKFSGNIKVSGSNQKGSISLEIYSGFWDVPDEILIYGISNASEIEQICRRKIWNRKNDPTPPSTISAYS